MTLTCHPFRGSLEKLSLQGPWLMNRMFMCLVQKYKQKLLDFSYSIKKILILYYTTCLFFASLRYLFCGNELRLDPELDQNQILCQRHSEVWKCFLVGRSLRERGRFRQERDRGGTFLRERCLGGCFQRSRWVKVPWVVRTILLGEVVSHLSQV